MSGRILLPFRWVSFRLHWWRHRDLLEAGVPVAMTPRPPDRFQRGERADVFAERIRHLLRRYSSPPETPEWMLPANVEEFLMRTEGGGQR